MDKKLLHAIKQLIKGAECFAAEHRNEACISEATTLRVRIDKVEKLLAGAAWQPIATAPLDGTSLLLLIPDRKNKGIPPVFVGAYHGQWYTRGECCSGTLNCDEPTHWMPLPAEPANG